MASQMPPELWLIVFRHATIIPGLFNTCSEPPCGDDLRSLDTPPGSPESYDTMRTKRNLVLVCKRWNTLGLAYLFEDVAIFSPDNGIAVLSAMERSTITRAQEDRSGSVPLISVGSFTKRIELRLNSFPDKSSILNSLNCITSILRHCYNLAVLVIRIHLDLEIRRTGAKVAESLLSILLSESNFSLCHLWWDSAQLPWQIPNTNPCLRSLEVLSLSIDHSDFHIENLSFPVLHTLKISGGGTRHFLLQLEKCLLPSLHSLKVESSRFNCPKRFFEAHGSRILRLNLTFSNAGVDTI
jgi:hypothetical protein